MTINPTSKRPFVAFLITDNVDMRAVKAFRTLPEAIAYIYRWLETSDRITGYAIETCDGYIPDLMIDEALRQLEQLTAGMLANLERLANI